MTETKTSSRKRAGFTLLELLAVVAIISILVMISVPVYHNVQENAEKKVLEYERCRAQMNRIYKRIWGEKQKDGKFEFHI